MMTFPAASEQQPNLNVQIFFRAACTALQARVRAITEIVAELQRGVKEGRDVNLNAIKRDVCCCRISMNDYTLLQSRQA